MHLRVKNTTRGQRGFYVDEGLVFVDAGATAEFTGASAAERDAAAAISGLRVQSKHGEEWHDHFEEDMPAAKPYLAIATDATGSNFKVIPLDGAWFIGVALASEQPDGPAGYDWTKIGGVNGSAAPEPSGVEAVTVPVDAGGFDASKVVAGNAVDAVAAIGTATPDQLAAIKDAETKREGGERKGVMKAIEEAEKKAAADPFQG